MRPFLKVCCIASLDEARTAVEHGASALGLVSAMPSGPGVIDEERIAEIAARTPPPIATFLLTCETRAESLVEQAQRCGTNTLQLVDAVEPEVHRVLRRELPLVRVVQVLHVRGEDALDEARRWSESADALLLDSGDPTLARKELGGTGRVHDWSLSRAIVELSRVPVFLAGGLRADNVRAALAAVRPFGVDVCTGVRTNGALDAQKLDALARAMWS